MTTRKLIASALTAGLFLFAGTSVASAGECHDQPMMARAMHSLEKAKEDLARAEHDKGGWRTAAIRSVDAALAETHRGCETANDRRR